MKKLKQIEIFLLLELFLLRLEIKKKNFSVQSKSCFVTSVIDYSKRYDYLLDFLAMIDFLGISCDLEYSHLCHQFTLYVRKFYKRIDNFNN